MSTSDRAAGSKAASAPVAVTPEFSTAYAMIYGAVAFSVVSVIAYSIWAFRLIRSEGVMYTAIAAVYIGLAGLALSRLVRGAGAWRRFPRVFAVAFIAYAAIWCAFWFGLKGHYLADLWGALLGLAAMTWILRVALGGQAPFLRVFAVVFLCHTVGYYLGGELSAAVAGKNGKLLWGAAHGLGFGAGLGYLLRNVRGHGAAP